MYIFWSAAAFFLAFFLPGSVLLRAFRIRQNWVTTFLCAVPASILCNYFLVFLATLFGVYSPIFLRGVFFAFLALLVFPAKQPIKTELFNEEERFSRLETVGIAIASGVLLYYTTRWIKSFGTILTWWDVLFSWNRWALDWFHGHLPTQTCQYPQVVPILYSEAYQMVGSSTVQFGAKALMNSIPILGSISILALSWVDPSLRWVGILGSIFFMNTVTRVVPNLSGLADAPTASIGAMWIALCLAYTKKREVLTDKFLYFLGAIAALVSLTKGSGLLYIGFFPVFILCFIRPQVSRKTLLKSVGLSLFLSLTWYVYKQWEIMRGLDQSNVSLLLHVVGVPYSERFLHGVHSLLDVFGAAQILPYLFLSLLGVVFTKEGRVFFLAAFLVFCIWAFGSSYDTRNFSLALPILAVLPGLGVRLNGMRSIRLSPPRRSAFGVMILFFAVSAIAGVVSSPEVLEEMQRSQTYGIERPDINAGMVDYFAKHPEAKGKLVSGYAVLSLIPELKDRFETAHCTQGGAMPKEGFPKDVSYFLLANFCEFDYRAEVAKQEAAGKLVRKRELHDYVLYEVNH